MKNIYKNKAFLFIISSHFIHKIAETLYDLALPLLVLHATGSSLLMGSMYALGFFAEFLVGFFGGAIVDSINRRKLLMFISALQALFISFLPISASFKFFNMVIIFLVAFALDICIAIYRIADTSIIPQLVEKEHLPQANGIMQMAISTAEAIGPAISGLLISTIGLFNSLWINFSTFILLLSTLSLIKSQRTELNNNISSPKQLWFSSVQGLHYTLKNPLFKLILIWNLFVNFGLSGSVLMIVFHLKEVIDLKSFEIGLVMTMSALGGITSGAIFSKIQAIFNSGKMLLISSLTTSIALFLFPFQNNWISSGIVVFALMFSVGLNSRLIYLLFQSSVPEKKLGRVIGASRLISTLLAPVSVLIAGSIAKINSNYVFIGGSIIIAISTIVALNTDLKRANWSVSMKSIANTESQ
ncbi:MULTISPECIES: MFS transporter [Anoxybacillaceae]|jgi:MFS family permease|uniref:MFS transporter n=1 Tax=Anoxybacteroides rupiense TaxID=311460 RepID=A0ABD5IYU5_9BACL|nr:MULTISPECIES: MFS transporter [Anoxybacillus]MBB3908358.1 MFS family permease [Anoxybacillus rupiensis]MED5053096.1 MFS transporter [Anoxybacillus rupiensis]